MRQEQQLQTALAALVGLRGVVTVGDGVDSTDLGPVGGRVAVTRWLPHETLLPHAAVVVTHAGHGTIMAGLAAGVPLVCLPMGRDQHGNAEQVERAGAGVQLDAAANATQLRAAIDRVISDPRFTESARRLSESVRGLGGGERLAAEVERLASAPPNDSTQLNATTSGRW